MAEKSPRPEEEEEEEDGEEAAEEAAEPPVRPVRVVTVKKEKSPEKAAAPDSPPPPPPGAEEQEEAPLLASPPSSPRLSPQPAVPDPPDHPADHPSVSGMNLFANDGSFMELFKKKMEAGSKEESKEPDKRKPVSLVGKRRGGAKLALKTGIVAKKPKTEDEEVLTHKGGAWAQYMAEVKKYKAHQCSDDDKTRPLVK